MKGVYIIFTTAMVNMQSTTHTPHVDDGEVGPLGMVQ